MVDERQLRHAICQAAYQLWTRGLIAGDGGAVTAELFRRRFLTTPAHARRAELQPEQVICVDIGGMNVQGPGGLPEIAWRPHRAGYKLNLAEAGALMEIGSRKRVITATALVEPPIVMALLRQRPDADELELGDLRVPVRHIDEENDIASALRVSPGVALRGVGLLCAEATLAATLNWIERVDQQARIELATGAPRHQPAPEPAPEHEDADADEEVGIEGVLPPRFDEPRIPPQEPRATPQAR